MENKLVVPNKQKGKTFPVIRRVPDEELEFIPDHKYKTFCRIIRYYFMIKYFILLLFTDNVEYKYEIEHLFYMKEYISIDFDDLNRVFMDVYKSFIMVKH